MRTSLAALLSWCVAVSAAAAQEPSGAGADALADPSRPSGPGAVPEPPTDPVPPRAAQPTPDGETYVEPDPVRRLDGWLHLAEDRAHTARMSIAILSLIVGAAAVSGAVWAYGRDEPGIRAGLGTVFVLDAVFQLGVGVAMLHLTMPQEDRWRRWSRARERGATPIDVASFAGELRWEAEMERFARTIGAVMGFAMAAGGLAGLSLAALTEMPDRDRVVAVAASGAFLGAGSLIGLLSLLVKSPVERDWERYERGLAPLEARELSMSVGPFLSRHGGGAALSGRF